MVTVGKKIKLDNNIKLLFRCDAGTKLDLGTGHVVRVIRLIEKLLTQRLLKEKQIYIMYRHEKGFELAKSLINKSNYNFKKIEFKANKIKVEEELILKSNANLIVFDVLEANKNLLLNLKKAKRYLIGFDDVGLGARYYDNHIISLIEPKVHNNNSYIGYKYLNLSETIKKKTYTRKNVKNIVISVGGNDKRQLVKLLILVLKSNSNKLNYSFIISKETYLKVKKIKTKIFNNKNFIFHVNPKNYSEIVASADIGIVSGGLTLFEFASAGVPTICIPQHKHQLINIVKLEKKNITIGLKNMVKVDKLEIKKHIDYLRYNYIARKKMYSNSIKYIDVKGLKRINKIFYEVKKIVLKNFNK